MSIKNLEDDKIRAVLQAQASANKILKDQFETSIVDTIYKMLPENQIRKGIWSYDPRLDIHSEKYDPTYVAPDTTLYTRILMSHKRSIK